jgi:hypothetical protein
MTDRLSTLTAEKLLDKTSRGFARFVSCLHATNGSPHFAAQQFAQRWPDDLQVSLVRGWNVEKAAVPAHSGQSDAALVPSPLATAFANYANAFALVTRFGRDGAPPLTRVPFDTRATLTDPQALSASFGWVRAGQAKPTVSIPFALPVVLRRAKASGLAVVTRELLRMAAPGADAHVRDVMARAIGLALDRLFVDPAISETDSSPASITNGGTSIGVSTGSATDDLRALLAAYVAQGGQMSSAVILLSSANAAALALNAAFPNLTARGGTIAGVSALASDAVGDLLIVVDASKVVLADDNEVAVDASENAALEMSSTPTMSVGDGSPATPTATSVVSMWQTNSAAIRCERVINWSAQADAVVYLTDAEYLTTGSPA